MKSFCISCIIYTIDGKDPKDNLYLNIFYQWLTMLIKNGGLTSNDMLHINIDTKTLEYLDNSHTILPSLLKKAACNFKMCTFEPPKTPLEGMMHKYDFNDYEQDIYIYTDIDTYILNPFRIMANELNPNTFYFIKGLSVTLDNKFFSEGFPESFIPRHIMTTLPGFNASLFVITSQNLRNIFFSRIHELCDYSTNYLCVEQPYFNRAVYEIPRNEISVNTDLLSIYGKFFGCDLNSRTVFLDFSGETSNGITHFTKMSGAMCLFILDSLDIIE
jgi:hypothetical protein